MRCCHRQETERSAPCFPSFSCRKYMQMWKTITGQNRLPSSLCYRLQLNSEQLNERRICVCIRRGFSEAGCGLVVNAMRLWDVVIAACANNFPLRERSIMCFARSVMRNYGPVLFTTSLPDAVTFHGYTVNMPSIDVWGAWGGPRKTGQRQSDLVVPSGHGNTSV